MNVWLAQHREALRWATQRLWATPLNTLLALLAIGIVLALPASGQMLLGNVLQLVQGSSSHATSSRATPQISLFMQLGSARPAVDAIAEKLQAHTAIRAVRFVSREETLKRMQADPGLREIIAALPQNPYPDAFVITPQNEAPKNMEQLRDDLQRWPGVEQVQLDSAWVRRLDAMLRLGRIGIAVLASLLGVGLIAITFTTLRLQIVARRAEIDLCRLLGATNGYIRRPFHYLGFLQGLLGGLVAWSIVFALTLLLREPVARLAALYDTRLLLQPLTLTESLLLLALAACLGWLGAALSLGHHLRDNTP